MRFTVRHETLYCYSVPVGLAPHRLRLEPRADSGLLVFRELLVEPLPVSRVQETDAAGNAVVRVEFAGQTTVLRVDSQFTVDTWAPPPLPCGTLPPLPWSPWADDALAPCLFEPQPDPAVSAFAADIASQCGGEPLAFLDSLCRAIHQRTDRHIRIDGDAHPPAATLATGRGACRDVTVLFMAACRSQHMPARFVSGYQAFAETGDGQRFLHAWPEVHLPGIGWRGWDPTHGTRVGDDHVALCAAPEQAGTMPVEGGFYANGVTATLDCRVSIQTR
ncbi:MAG: transglutaminase family protein [Rhodocyclaceae bacterium]|nr:transglutaminase family protein [Rhodocyclaceae bacterium]